MTEAYPLQWPAGRPRTHYPAQSKFGVRTIDQAVRLVREEIRRLKGGSAVISSNMRLRLDGLPYSNQAQPQDKGVSVFFSYNDRSMCFSCDRWDKVQDNIYAIAKTIEALRGIERWGSGDMMQQAFTGFVALPPQESAWYILGIKENASINEIEAAYKAKAKTEHPDAGGSTKRFQRVRGAYERLMNRTRKTA